MAYRASAVKKPSEEMHDALMGVTPWDAVPDAIRSWAQKPIHDAAREILAMPKPVRKGALGCIPAMIRPMVDAEMIRLYRGL